MQGLRQTDCILHQVLPYQSCNGNLKKVIQDCPSRTSLLGLFSSHSFGNVRSIVVVVVVVVKDLN